MINRKINLFEAALIEMSCKVTEKLYFSRQTWYSIEMKLSGVAK